MGTTLENTIKLANSLKKEKLLNKLEEERINVQNGKYKPMEIDEVFTHLDDLQKLISKS